VSPPQGPCLPRLSQISEMSSGTHALAGGPPSLPAAAAVHAYSDGC
jgi:hypothetical protein